MNKIDFTADPLAVFRHSKTPPGLYARQKWLTETDPAKWQADFQDTVGRLYQGQGSDGSWDRSPLDTIRRLFGLHLTVRAADPAIEKALTWLDDHVGTVSRNAAVPSGKELRGLPFQPGRPDVLYRSAAVFLSTIFGFAAKRQVRGFRRDLVETLDREESGPIDGASLSNILRALVVQPDPARQMAVDTIIRRIGRAQRQNGTWNGFLPFYQTVNALAHLASPEIDQILFKAFTRLARTQHAAGHWGDGDGEWNTFLVFHALRNRGLL